jgi:hypothetical protein
MTRTAGARRFARAKCTTTAAALALLAACGGPAAPWASEPATVLDLELAVTPTTVQLLEPVTVTLDLFRRDGVAVDFAPAVDAKDFAATTTVAPEVPLFGGHWQRTTLVLRPLRGPGELQLPAFTATAKEGAGAASTPAQTITVTSALAGAGAAIEAPGEPFATPFGGWWWVGGGAAALAAGALVLWLLRRARQRRPDVDAVAVPPHVKALRALQRLRGAERTTPAQIDAWYVEVSQVLRVYLEERFGLRAPERTTEEFLRELEGGEELARSHRRELERFLSQCDLVKFAGLVPADRDHQTTWELAAAFVEATRGDGAGRPAEAVA